MFDGFWSGIFGGLFGPAIIIFLKRYRLRTVFLTTFFGTYLLLFLSGVWYKGWKFAWQRMFDVAAMAVDIGVPLGIGLLCMITVAICGPDMFGKSREKK